MTTVTIELPEATAAMARREGLLSEEVIRDLLEEATRVAAMKRLQGMWQAVPVYRAIPEHFTLSGRDPGEAFGDSFVRALAAIDDELNDARITRSSKAV